MLRKRKAFLTILTLIVGGMIASTSAPASGQSLDELHKLALKEGGTLNFYGTLAQINAEKILPVFEKRFPGIKVNHVDATADKLAARAITEARGGRVLADVFQMARAASLSAVRSEERFAIGGPKAGGRSAPA